MIDEALVNAIQDWDFEVSDVPKRPNEIDAKNSASVGAIRFKSLYPADRGLRHCNLMRTG
jgi:hypothetical protein